MRPTHAGRPRLAHLVDQPTEALHRHRLLVGPQPGEEVAAPVELLADRADGAPGAPGERGGDLADVAAQRVGLFAHFGENPFPARAH